MSRPVLLIAVIVLAFAGCSGLDSLDRQEPTNYDPHVTVIDIGEGGNTEALAFSPDGRLLAAASDVVRLWDVAAGRTVLTVVSGSLVEQVVAFSPDGRLLVTSGDMTDDGIGSIFLWDPVSGQRLDTLSGLERLNIDVAFSPDGTTLAAASFNNGVGSGPKWMVKLWDVATRRATKTLSGDGYGADIAFSHDGALLAVSSDVVQLFRMPDLQVVDRFPGSKVAFSPDGNLIAVSTGGPLNRHDVLIRDMAGGARVTIPAEGVVDLEFSPDSTILAIGTMDGVVRLCDVQSGQVLATDPGRLRLFDAGGVTATEGRVEDVAFSPDGRTVATADWYTTVRLLDVAGALADSTPSRSPGPSVSASP